MRKYRGAAASAVSPARIQLQRRRIDAIAQAGRLRPIRKHVAEMCVTARAQYLDAAHAVRAVLARNHRSEESRVGHACVRQCSSRWSPDIYTISIYLTSHTNNHRHKTHTY